MLKSFRAYQRSLEFHQCCTKVKGPPYLLEQLQRAAASITLNLAEGYGRFGVADRRKFYRIAFASARECQAALDLLPESTPRETARKLADEMAAATYSLCRIMDKQHKKQTGLE
ncbi:hypothetical protein FACS189487_11250 [Campylobacterota bacterium]|jgi:four helix bundle protein|nr:hypothetical protein FACS189487_11250 [Campylobacterota bacterium]